MTIAVAQGIKKSRATTGTSLTTDPVSVAGGSLIVVGFIEASTGQSITDSQGGTYTQINSRLTGHLGRGAQWYYRENINADGAFTITASVSGAACLITIVALEITGAASGPFDVSAQADDFSSPYNSGATATTAQANSLLVGFAGGQDNSGVSSTTVDASSTPTAGWTNGIEETDGSQFLLAALWYQRVTSTGAYNFAYTLSSPAADHGDSMIAVFEENLGGAPGAPAIGKAYRIGNWVR